MDGTVQPFKKNTTTKDINKFKVYVTEDKYFESNLLPLSITNTSDVDYKDTPGIITSMMRYHLYYQIGKFLKDPSKLERYISRVPNTIKRHKPTSDVWTDAFYQGHKEILTWLSEQKDRNKLRNYKYHKNPRGVITGIAYQKVTGQTPNDVKDYEKFIATTTDGLTQIGQKLLQQSVESYVYAVLGAQAKTRWPIVEKGAKSLQTQEVFHTIVKETIAESDVTITISNMRTAIASTNVILNMAISPGMILVPSNLIIQKEKIPGYNNVLTLATDKMKFGENTGVNYKAPNTVNGIDPTPTNADATQTNRVGDATPKTTRESVVPTPKPTQTNANVSVSKPKVPIASVASEILGVTMMVGGFLFSKYIF